MKRVLVIAGGLLAACGNDASRSNPLPLPPTDLVQTVRGADATPAVRDPKALAALAVSQLAEPVAIAVVPELSAVAALVPYGRNGDVVTWSTIERQTVALRGGVVQATRGLGSDVMYADAAPTLSALAAGGGQYGRRIVSLNAANEDETYALTCRMARVGPESVVLLASNAPVGATRFRETCAFGGKTIVNDYWRTADGTVRQSRQWLGPRLGYLEWQVQRPER